MKKIHEGKVVHIRMTEKRVNNHIVELSNLIEAELDKNPIDTTTIRLHVDMIEFWQDTLFHAETKNSPVWCIEVGCEYDEEE